MTEDGAVFGGQNNLHEGLENAIALYHPKMIAIFTSCMPEIIGDDLSAFLKNARQKGIVPADLPVAFANTPSASTARTCTATTRCSSPSCRPSPRGSGWRGAAPASSTCIPGFDTNTGNYREYKRILEAFGIPYTILADISESFDSPCDGTYRLYPGGTPLAEAADSINGKATLTVGPYATTKTFAWLKDHYAGAHAALPMPIGIAKTDAFLMKLSELFGQPGPRRAQGRARPRRRRHDRRAAVHARQEVRRLRRSGPPARLRLLPARDGGDAGPRPLRRRARRSSRRSCRRCSTPRPTARGRRST